MKKILAITVLCVIAVVAASAQEQFPVIKDAGGYWALPKAAVQPDKSQEHKAIFAATRAADSPKDLLPALEDAAALVNGLAAGGVPASKRKIAVVFYGPAAYAVLENGAYRQKYGTDNPNLKLLAELRNSGVELLLCGQWLQYKKIAESKVVSDVTIASDAFIVLVTYQNRGFARMPD